MTRNEDMTTGRDARRFGRPARIAVAAAAALATGGLLAGCGDKDSDASGPNKVAGDAAPADSSSHSKDSGSTGGSTTGGGDSDGKNGGTGGTGGLKTNGTSGGGNTGGSTTGGKSDTDNGSGASGLCTAQDLKGSIGPNHPGAGQENFALVLTNKSGASCTVKGFPGFAFLNGDGDQVSVDPERNGEAGKAVKLAPGKSAWAPLSFSNPQMTDVPTVTPDAALITPPDQRSSIRVDWTGGEVTATGKASVPKIGSLSAGTGS